MAKFVVSIVLACWLALAGWARAEDASPDASHAAGEEGGGAEIAPSTEDRKQQARSHFLRGVSLGRAGEWDAALREFQKSRELHPTRASLLNIAVSLYNLRRYVQALEAYEALERDLSGSAAERQNVRAIVAKLRGLVGEVVITSNVPEPRVEIDGRDHGPARAQRPLRVEPGTHRLRVSKEGYIAVEREFQVESGQAKEIDVTLLHVSEASQLDVREAAGRALDVLIDGTVAGKTPFLGLVSPGQHVVQLRGAGRDGTVPVQVRVARGQRLSLTLRAVELDADVRVSPTPPSARVEVDGVPLGVGIWQGRLPSGPHRFDVHADGHLPWRRLIVLRPGAQHIAATLERDPGRSVSRGRFLDSVYLDLGLGPAGTLSFGGGAKEEPPPLGGIATLRAGYRVTSRLAVEVLGGYLRLFGKSEEELELPNTDPAPVPFRVELRQETRLSAAVGGLGLGYQLLERVPLVARLAGGAARGYVEGAVRGRFRATITHPQYPDVTHDYDRSAGFLERPQTLWIPFVVPELRLGHAVSKRLTLDVGLAAWLLFAPSYPRLGGLSADPETRSIPLADVEDGYPLPPDREGTRTVKPGIVRLPREVALGTMVVISPSVAARFSF